MTQRPTPAQLGAELKRIRGRRQFRFAMRGAVYTLIFVAALSLALCWICPVVRVSSASMTGTLNQGDIALSIRDPRVEKGDVILFHYGEKLLIKRVIAAGGDEVTILEDGSVQVNGQALQEDYVTRPALEPCTIEFPFTVPENQLFVLGDCRADSLDSRSEKLGTVAAEQVVGKVLLRIWPLENITLFK